MTQSVRRLDAEFLAEVARQHNAHVAAGWPPVRAIAVAHQVPRATAAWWIARARKAGLHLASGHGLQQHYPGRAIVR